MGSKHLSGLGFINRPFQTAMCMCAGKNPPDDYLEGMMSEAPGPINFTMFLTMFGERLNGTDPEDVIRNAFACFDEEGSGEPDTTFSNLYNSQECNYLIFRDSVNLKKKKKDSKHPPPHTHTPSPGLIYLLSLKMFADIYWTNKKYQFQRNKLIYLAFYIACRNLSHRTTCLDYSYLFLNKILIFP